MTDGPRAGIPLVLGGNVFGWTADPRASFAVLDAFVAGGGRMIDTADVYSAWVPGHAGGESERMIGDWLRTCTVRGDIRIHTKVGMLPGEGGKGLSPTRIAAAADASLARLGVERIALYYAHRDDPDMPQMDVLAAFDALVRAGKVASIGASNMTAPRVEASLALSAANGLAAYAALQPEYNLVSRRAFVDRLRATRGGDLNDYEGALQRLAIDRGLHVFPYYGLAAGFLTGKYRCSEDLTGARAGRVGEYVNAHGLAVLRAMDAVAADTGATLAQIALAWLNAQPGITAPIASATSVAQVEELVAATHLTLAPEHLGELDASGLDTAAEEQN